MNETMAVAGLAAADFVTSVTEFSALAARETVPIATEEAVPISRFLRDISSAVGVGMG